MEIFQLLQYFELDFFKQTASDIASAVAIYRTQFVSMKTRLIFFKNQLLIRALFAS